MGHILNFVSHFLVNLRVNETQWDSTSEDERCVPFYIQFEPKWHIMAH